MRCAKCTAKIKFEFGVSHLTQLARNIEANLSSLYRVNIIRTKSALQRKSMYSKIISHIRTLYEALEN